MNVYILYIEDDRYSTPNLLSIEREDDDSVLVHALKLLTSSSHYLAIDVWEENRRVGRLSRPAPAI